MRKIAAILILTAVAVFCAVQVEVDLMLRNGTPIRVAVPKGAFTTIDSQKNFPFSDSNDGPPSPKRAKIEDMIPLVRCEFDSRSEYAQFRKLWDIDTSALSPENSALPQEQTSLTEDISADLFEKYFLTANYLLIQGEYSKRFFKNMVKYGLLGAHSADIMASEVFSTHYLFHSTFGDLFQGFLEQAGFNYRVVHLSAGQLVLKIEKDDVHPKNIDKEYTGSSQIEKRRTVLYSELGPTGSQEKRRNEAVLSWLLWNMGGFSADIQYSMDISSEGLSELRQTIQNFTKEKTNETDGYVYVEGLTLDVNYKNHASLSTVLRLVPSLSRLELSMSSPSILNAAVSSLVNSIPLCKSLKMLKITGKLLSSVVISRLVESLPNIEQLVLCCKPLENTAIESLKKCVYLESLEVYRLCQPSAVVQALVSHLSSLKTLSIKCKVLEPAAVESFKACIHLEKLEIYGSYQPSAVVQALVKNLPSLKELSIECDILESTATESFQEWTKLEKLKMFGKFQPSTTVQTLVSHLSSLKELSIRYNALDSTAAERFQTCKKLEKLNMYGDPHPSAVVQALVKNLFSLKELNIECEPLTPIAAESFKAYKKLEKLNMFGGPQPSTTVQALVKHLSSLKELTIECQPLEPAAAESFKACKKLEKLTICGDVQPSTAVEALVKHLSSLKDLSIECNILESAAAESFESCALIQKLYIFGGLQSSAVVQILVRHLSALKELTITCDVLDSTAAESFEACAQLQKLEVCGLTHPSASFLIKLLEVCLLLQDIRISIDSADLALAGALRKCPNLRFLRLIIRKYTTGFLAYYFQDPLPKLKALTLYSSNSINNYSEEDIRAVKHACATGIRIARH